MFRRYRLRIRFLLRGFEYTICHSALCNLADFPIKMHSAILAIISLALTFQASEIKLFFFYVSNIHKMQKIINDSRLLELFGYI